MNCDNTLYFQSVNELYGVEILQSEMTHIQELCVAALPNETGGILIGHYSDNMAWAIITKVTGPPLGSIHRATSFIRNGDSILTVLARLWDKKEYYIGEWHYHPYSSPSPSPRDLNTMYALSKSKRLHCPEPVMLVIGGSPPNWVQHIAVYVNKCEITLNNKYD